MPATLTVELKKLRFFAAHGWHEEESKTGNEFELDIIAAFATEAAIISSLAETINYATVYEVTKKVFLEREKLLETCATKIAAALHQAFPQIQKLSIRITKLNAPITNFIGTVGIQYAIEY